MLEDRLREALVGAVGAVPARVPDPADAAIARARRTLRRRRVGYGLVAALSLLVAGTTLVPGSGRSGGVMVTPGRYASPSAHVLPAGVSVPSPWPSPPVSPPRQSPAWPGHPGPGGLARAGMFRADRVYFELIKRNVVRLDSALPDGVRAGSALPDEGRVGSALPDGGRAGLAAPTRPAGCAARSLV